MFLGNKLFRNRCMRNVSEEEMVLDEEIEGEIKKLCSLTKQNAEIQDDIADVAVKLQDRCRILRRFEKRRAKICQYA
jgi:hypothetical protein